MGIYIPGMEMPRNCCACPLFKSDMSKQLFCKAFDAFEKSDYDKLPIGRMHNCPLIFVSPHGRLIDVDELKKESQYSSFSYANEKIIFESDIDDVPTIIPAELPKEET